MMSSTKDKFFLDTNIIVYSFDKSDLRKQEISQDLIRESLRSGLGCISYQVVQEFLNVSTKKFKISFDIVELSEYITKVLEPLCEVFPTIDLYRR